MSSKAAALTEAREDHEPSMEEILASIRKIIADDTLGTKKDEPVAKKPVPKKEPEPAPVFTLPEPVDVIEDEDADVLDLGEVATVASKPQEIAVELPEPEPKSEEVMVEAVAAPLAVPVAAKAPPPAPPRAPVTSVVALEERILSENAGSLVSQAFQSLARHTPMPQAGRSLEDVVVELIRPMLRGWLDDHLPGIVEKLVKAEIERVARG